ncbi:type-2 ice-structuring protein isoform X1 [Perca flavescens]|uniref:type-2 ice-structuring protein isoform X1 n=1 Tax=Perca flavescens TaxID=8167 RepID=UPI00106E40A0|nr:type-2 ice-structuring protein-like isoform X1 [Perca flavescens]
MLTVSLLVCAMMALATADDAYVTSSNSSSNVSNNSSSNSSSYAEGPACPASWHKYNDRCFLFIPRTLDWSDAEKNCQSSKGNLASVHSVEEYQFIQMIIKQQTHGNPITWIGGHDSPKNNVWFWSDGRPFSFTFWCAGEPNNGYGNQDCIQMNFGEHNCWDDVQCSIKLPSVCARNP